MNKERAKVRSKLRDIGSVKDFQFILDNTMLSEEEKKILEMHYKEGHTLSYIADEIGMSEISIKKKHAKILMKVGKTIQDSF